MNQQSMSNQAKGKGKSNNTKLPFAWKMVIWITMGILSLGKFVYSIEWFNIRTADNCILDPSPFDIFLQDLTSVSAILLAFSLVAGIYFLENK